MRGSGLGNGVWHGWRGRRSVRRMSRLWGGKGDGREEGEEDGGRRRMKSWRLLKLFTLGLEEESYLGTRPAVTSQLGNTSPIVSVSGTSTS